VQLIRRDIKRDAWGKYS